jgi:hypothetical protein
MLLHLALYLLQPARRALPQRVQRTHAERSLLLLLSLPPLLLLLWRSRRTLSMRRRRRAILLLLLLRAGACADWPGREHWWGPGAPGAVLLLWGVRGGVMGRGGGVGEYGSGRWGLLLWWGWLGAAWGERGPV